MVQVIQMQCLNGFDLTLYTYFRFVCEIISIFEIFYITFELDFRYNYPTKTTTHGFAPSPHKFPIVVSTMSHQHGTAVAANNYNTFQQNKL